MKPRKMQISSKDFGGDCELCGILVKVGQLYLVNRLHGELLPDGSKVFSVYPFQLYS